MPGGFHMSLLRPPCGSLPEGELWNHTDRVTTSNYHTRVTVGGSSNQVWPPDAGVSWTQLGEWLCHKDSATTLQNF